MLWHPHHRGDRPRHGDRTTTVFALRLQRLHIKTHRFQSAPPGTRQMAGTPAEISLARLTFSSWPPDPLSCSLSILAPSTFQFGYNRLFFSPATRRASRTSRSRRPSLESAAAPPKIGLIGLGLMGRPMGMNLIKAGYSLTVWNRTASRAEELVANGAKLANSPHEVAAASDFLLTMVSDPPTLEEILWGPSGAMQALQRGSTYIDSSTISPALARKIAAACAE